MQKMAQKLVLPFIFFSVFESAFALDSGTQSLGELDGATDYFKITCAGNTDHLDFQLFESAATVLNTPLAKPTLIPPQILNATLTKLKLTAKASGIAAGINKDVTLKGGNGSYTFTLDTIGTNLTLKTAQTYSVQYQCLNTTGKVTVGSSTLTKSGIASISKTLANSRTVKYLFNCAKDKINGNTDSLKITVINKTPIAKTVVTTTVTTDPIAAPISSGNLAAQVIKGHVAMNTIGDILNVHDDRSGGDGYYSVMVNSPSNKVQSYHFQYSCLNTSNLEEQTSPFQLLQDQ